MTEPKPNNCKIRFYCKTPENCVYYSELDNGRCKYRDINFECHSAIAKFNVLTLKAKPDCTGCLLAKGRVPADPYDKTCFYCPRPDWSNTDHYEAEGE